MTEPIRTACVVREVARARYLLDFIPALRTGRNAWLLDSALPSPRLGRFSFAGADPYLVMTARGGEVSLTCGGGTSDLRRAANRLRRSAGSPAYPSAPPEILDPNAAQLPSSAALPAPRSRACAVTEPICLRCVRAPLPTPRCRIASFRPRALSRWPSASSWRRHRGAACAERALMSWLARRSRGGCGWRPRRDAEALMAASAAEYAARVSSMPD
jgi:hypothetical protein